MTFSASILTFSPNFEVFYKFWYNPFFLDYKNHLIKIRWFCVEKVNIEALKGKLFNFNENNENHKVYPSAFSHAVYWVHL
jgi:hypothetical protein